ncbi:MAG: 2-hydroxychromene-2-carboxylate isomerase [Polyangiaceae bacterium]
MAGSIRFHYDFVCPYAFLASLRVEAVAQQIGARVSWEPILLGGVFKAIGAPDRPRMSEGRARYNLIDLKRQADRAGVELRAPSDHPRRTVLALRAAIGSSDIVAASRALYAAYWLRGEDLEDPRVVRSALDGAGLDGAAALEAAHSESVKADLRARTDRAIASGVFGVPTMLVGDAPEDFYWGNDRLDLLLPPRPAAPDRAPDPARKIAFYFDFSSPYAYLASTQIRALARRAGATIDYRPILLGGLFKAIDTPNVPIFEMPAPKRRYQGVELVRWAKRWGVPFTFSTRFPLQTTKALRLVLVAPDEQREALIHALFEAAWARDEDLSDHATLTEIAARASVSFRELAPRTVEDAVKLELRKRTEAAQAAGVFGVPTFAVNDPSDARAEGAAVGGGSAEWFWGQDRLDEVEERLSR